MRALGNFRRLARVRRVDRIRVVATSAVREARNRAEFIRRIRRETGIAVEVISGIEEARLIFQAARHALGLEGGPYLLVDVGGGSVELVLVEDGRPLWMRSVKLGAARLAERFLTDDPPSRAQLRRLEAHLERAIGPLLRKARRKKSDPRDRHLGHHQYDGRDGTGRARRRVGPPPRRERVGPGDREARARAGRGQRRAPSRASRHGSPSAST